MGNITWTKSWTAADNGTVFGGADIQNIQSDITTVVNGGITNSNVSAGAAIAESKVAFDASAGHDHDGTDSKSVAWTQTGYISDAELVYVSSDTLKATSGIIEINGTIYARTSDSSTIDISAVGDRIAGTANAASTWFYIYAYNDTGTSWDLKWWNLAPQYSNAGTDTSGALKYRQSGGVWYRCIGAVYNNSGQTLVKWFQNGAVIMLDVPFNVATAASAGAWSAATSALMPTISTMGIFGLKSRDTNEDTCALYLRPNGGTWTTDDENSTMIQVAGGTATTITGQRICATDTSQQIQYQTVVNDDTPTIDLEGYILNIR